MDAKQTGLLIALAVIFTFTALIDSQTTRRPAITFEPLKQSDLLRAKAMLKWLVDNSTENSTTTFNAGFIRMSFHDCVGGCDGCLNLRNPSNAGLGFYKTPLDLMYTQFIHPMMSRADWYALAGFTAVEYAAERTPCTDYVCVPPMEFKWGRKDCANETRLFRRMPGPDNDPRDTIRRTFRMNLLEITALMGAHTLGKNHANGATWVGNETLFDNQYYKDLIDEDLKWRKGVRQGPGSNTWSHGDTGNNIMLTSDFFMGFDVGTSFGDCNNNPIMTCKKSSTFTAVERFAGDNEYWLLNFGAAFSVMLNSGNFGKLKSVVWDTFDEVFTGELFPPRNETVANETSRLVDAALLEEFSNSTESNSTALINDPLNNTTTRQSEIGSGPETTTATLSPNHLTNISPNQENNPLPDSHSSSVLLSSDFTATSMEADDDDRDTTLSILGSASTRPASATFTRDSHTTPFLSTISATISRTRTVVTAKLQRSSTSSPQTPSRDTTTAVQTPSTTAVQTPPTAAVQTPPTAAAQTPSTAAIQTPRIITENAEGFHIGVADPRVGYAPSRSLSRRALRKLRRQRRRQRASARKGRKRTGGQGRGKQTLSSSNK